MSKWLLRVGIVVLTIVAILLTVNAFFIWKTGARLESQLADLKAAGEPIALKDLARPPIPPEKNAATYLERARGDAAMIEKEIYALFPRGMSFEKPPDPNEQGKAQKVFDAYPKAIPLLEQAAACADYDAQLDYSVSGGMFIAKYLPHIQESRLFARVLRERTVLLAARGRRDDALAGMTLLFRLTRHFDRDPLMVGGLVAIACRGVAIEGANAVLQSGRVNNAVREALDREVSRHDPERAYVGVLKTERALSLDMIREFPWNQHWVTRALSYSCQSHCLETMQEYLTAASMPYYKLKAPEPFPNEALQKWWFLEFPDVAIVKLLRPGQDAYRIAVESDRATIRELRVLIALQTKAGADAAQPPKFSDLGLPSDVTTDPFDGQPLRVKKLPKGWLIYSVGPNRIDDSGTISDRTDVGIGPPGYERRSEKK